MEGAAMTDETRQSPAETLSHAVDPKVRLLIDMIAAANGRIDATEHAYPVVTHDR